MVELDPAELEAIFKEHEKSTRAKNRAIIEYIEEQRSTVKYLEMKLVRGQSTTEEIK